ncbi:hypothetical protein CJA_3401 [Cellvibrio japonicus Ueda107]|uniref:Uncharacterized protein n=1 Tax=Cellvibrio japonicus (strain Ueda107) TaxID=498211 RepID=B3PF88_CELJU|nr:hypothetical protein CJA_3401 [Cellvibrio japonicus Ueda107]
MSELELLDKVETADNSALDSLVLVCIGGVAVAFFSS